jgi:hypothetical protein
MAKQTVGIGTTPNDGTGDDLRTGADKINGNFNEIYAALGDGSTLLTLASVATSGKYGELSGTPVLGTAAETDATDYATAVQGQTADSAVQPDDNADTLGSGVAVDGYVLTADGVGGAAWEAGGGGGGAADYVRTRSGTTQDLFAMADTWNDEAKNFTSIKMNVTDTASDAGSLLLDLQVGGVSKFKINKSGEVSFGLGDPNNCSINFGQTFAGFFSANGFDVTYSRAGAKTFQLGFNRASVGSSGYFGFASSASADGLVDLQINRDGAGILAQRRGTNAQLFRGYNTYTDASNGEWIDVGFDTNVAVLRPQANGTGAVRDLHISGLPTSNPGPGILWNDAGAVKVGT